MCFPYSYGDSEFKFQVFQDLKETLRSCSLRSSETSIAPTEKTEEGLFDLRAAGGRVRGTHRFPGDAESLGGRWRQGHPHVAGPERDEL